jgi:two-component system, NtrC family, response regulator AtoC
VEENIRESVRLLVVSREPAVLRPLLSVGESNAWNLETASSGWGAIEQLQSGLTPDMLLLDLARRDHDSLLVLRWVRRIRPGLPIIVVAYPEDAERKREAMRLGAHEFLVRPVDEKVLELTITKYLGPSGNETETDFSHDEIEEFETGFFFVGSTPIMQKLRAQAELLAQADVPVLIVGEAGSGKDTAAHLIHSLSIRSGCRFLKVNCSALPRELLEPELFGTDHGSPALFTRPKSGRLEACQNGTILIDEISEMPPTSQQKLLQVIREKRFFRHGSKEVVPVDVRILATSSMSVERAISERKLREDLGYRLSSFTLHIPPLRQRRDEVPLLLEHFMHRIARHYGIVPRTFSLEVLSACQSYGWPGNLKELESFVKRFLVIGEDDLSVPVPDASSEGPIRGGARFHKSGTAVDRGLSDTSSPGDADSGSLKALVHNVKLEAERNAIAAALEKTGWNRKAAARLLKVSYRTILYKIEQFHMKAPDSYSSPVVLEEASSGNGNGWRYNGKVG